MMTFITLGKVYKALINSQEHTGPWGSLANLLGLGPEAPGSNRVNPND